MCLIIGRRNLEKEVIFGNVVEKTTIKSTF